MRREEWIESFSNKTVFFVRWTMLLAVRPGAGSVGDLMEVEMIRNGRYGA